MVDSDESALWGVSMFTQAIIGYAWSFTWASLGGTVVGILARRVIKSAQVLASKVVTSRLVDPASAVAAGASASADAMRRRGRGVCTYGVCAPPRWYGARTSSRFPGN